MLLTDFDFTLPDTLIAKAPVHPRDASRLLHITDYFSDKQFSDLPSLLKEGDLLVFNNTKVIPARLIGKRGEATIDINLHKCHTENSWYVFARPAKRLRVGDTVVFAENFSAVVKEKTPDNEILLQFNATGEAFYHQLECHGAMPLPPYIKRGKAERVEEDKTQYQTIYAKERGAVAAPTAGLHFTDEVMKALDVKGIKRAYVTLHVGAGTFLPVKVDDIRAHKMHSESYVLPEETARAVNETRRAGGRVVAVGTTSLRVLESVACKEGLLTAAQGDTDIFITPGYRFKAVDLLITNFHLPKSTLFMLVCAFAGKEKMQAAYQHAIAHRYRFYSYGDACVLECNSPLV